MTTRPTRRSRTTSGQTSASTVWPTRSCSTTVELLDGRICPRMTSSRPPGRGSVGSGAIGAISTRSEKERSARMPQVPRRRWRWASWSSSRLVRSKASSAGVATGQPRPDPGCPAAAEGADTAISWGRRPRKPRRVSHPGVGQELAQVVGPLGHVGQGVGVRGRGERDPVVDEALEQRGCRVLLAHRLAPAGRRHLGGHARAHRRLGDAVVELVRHAGDPSGDLDQVRVGEHVAHPGGAQLLHGPGVLVPHRVDVPVVPLGQHLGVAQDVEPPRPEPVHRAEQHVEGVAGQEVGHVVHPVLVVVDLEAEHDRAGRRP